MRANVRRAPDARLARFHLRGGNADNVDNIVLQRDIVSIVHNESCIIITS